MKIEATFEPNGSLTLIFPELSPADSFHLGYLSGILDKLRVPVTMGSAPGRNTILRIGISHDVHFHADNEPALPFGEAKTGGD